MVPSGYWNKPKFPAMQKPWMYLTNRRKISFHLAQTAQILPAEYKLADIAEVV